MARVLLACPLYDDRMVAGPSRAFWRTASRQHQVHEQLVSFSIIDTSCTAIWCDALNNRGLLDYMAILHGDVTPPDWWLDTLIDEAEKHGADFLSALVPVKDDRGFYSTAISLPDGKRHFVRLTVQQVMRPEFPTTFGLEEAAEALERLPEPYRVPEVPRGGFLFANTGCMICRVDRPWAEQVLFDAETIIDRGSNGRLIPYTLGEDWVFSREIARHGGKVMATKAILPAHRGAADFRSEAAWGQPRETPSQPHHAP